MDSIYNFLLKALRGWTAVGAIQICYIIIIIIMQEQATM